MSASNRLALPFIDAAQAQKHVTHNEALVDLDALVHLAVKARNVTAPPGSPAEGDRYLVGAAPTGAFLGKMGAVAAFDNGGWAFFSPRAGWRCFVEAESLLIVFDGANWNDLGLALQTLQNLSRLGVGASADANNPLSVKANAALFAAKSTGEGGNGDLRFTLNKSASGNTVSQLYQTNWSGRAETGLTGDDRFHIKVSPDGATWRDAMAVDAATGQPAFPQGIGDGAPRPFRNRLRNAQFLINQRGVAGTVTLTAGQYGHDGVKAGASGCTYTFAQSGLDVTITISSGSLILPIEANLIEGGVYTLSQAGSAPARVWQGTGSTGSGAYASAPFQTATLAVNTQTNVEFSTGSVLRPQLESGAVATAFDRRPKTIEDLLAWRYFVTSYNDGVTLGAAASSPCEAALAVATAAGASAFFPFLFPGRMRATPTVTIYDQAGVSGAATVNGASSACIAADLFQTGFGAIKNMSGGSWAAGASVKFGFAASAEI